MGVAGTSARQRVADFWDAHQAEWLAGRDPLPPLLGRWFDSYQGTGRGAVTRDGFAEPYQGDVLGLEQEPRVVILGLNPGRFIPDLQSRTGQFAHQIRACGSYTAWARGYPYDNETWLACHRPNLYFRARLSFTRRWLGDPAASHNAMLIYEMYPWHSTAVTARMRPPVDAIDTFVWQPIAEVRTQHVFAFGTDWTRLAHDVLRLPVLARLGRGGADYGSQVPSRAVVVFALPSGQHLVTESHAGSAGPPAAAEVELLRVALASLA